MSILYKNGCGYVIGPYLSIFWNQINLPFGDMTISDDGFTFRFLFKQWEIPLNDIDSTQVLSNIKRPFFYSKRVLFNVLQINHHCEKFKSLEFYFFFYKNDKELFKVLKKLSIKIIDKWEFT